MDSAKIDLQREEFVERIKEWFSKNTYPPEEVVNKDLSPNDIALKIRTEPDESNKTHHFFAVFPGGHDLMWISAYVYFTESDKIGFKLLKTEQKITFANLMKIPLLTLNLNYT